MTSAEIRAAAAAALAKTAVPATASSEAELVAADAALASAAAEAANPSDAITLPEGAAPTSAAAVAAITGNNPQVDLLQNQLALALQKIAELSALVPKPVDPAAPVLPKIYFSVTPFINVPIMRAPGHCTNVTFVAGILETSDPVVQAVLEAAITAGGSGFSHGPAIGTDEYENLRSNDMNEIASRAHARMIGAGEKTG